MMGIMVVLHDCTNSKGRPLPFKQQPVERVRRLLREQKLVFSEETTRLRRVKHLAGCFGGRRTSGPFETLARELKAIGSDIRGYRSKNYSLSIVDSVTRVREIKALMNRPCTVFRYTDERMFI